MSQETTDTGFPVQIDEGVTDFDLSPHLVNLLMHEPFFSSIMRNIWKVKTQEIPTAGVTVKGLGFVMYWNPGFLASLESLEVRGLLKHECYHLIFKHVTSRKQDPHRTWNWATDLAINSLISEQELPQDGLLPGRALNLSKIEDPTLKEKWKKVSDLIQALPKNQSSEWYMIKLQEDEEVSDMVEGKGSEQFVCDEHDGWGNLSDEDKQIAEGKIKQAVSDAVKKCDRTGQWGTVSAETRSTLRKMISNSVNWKKVLQSFCGNSQRANRSKTHRRVNRKYPYIHPGVRKGHTASVAIYMDQSGSVSDDEVSLLFGALNKLGKITSFTIYPFDWNVQEEAAYKWRKGQKPEPIRHLHGGTSFNAVEKHVRENKEVFDGHIILTDGGASDPGPSRQRRCWVLLPGTSLPFKPHRGDVVVKMESEA